MENVLIDTIRKFCFAFLVLFSFQANADILLSEDFSGGAMPASWSTTAVQGSDVWVVRSSPAFTSTSGSFYAVFDDQALGAGVTPTEALLNLPSVNCTGRTAVYLRMEHHWREVENTHGTIEVSIDGGTIWSTLIDFELGSRGTLGVPQDTTFDITTLAAGQADVRVRFRYDDGGQAGRYWYLDDVVIYSGNDVGITDMTIPNYLGCASVYGAGETVTVEVTNFGFNPIVNVPIVVEVTGGTTITLNTVLAGPLAGGASAIITLPGTVNMLADAVYDFDCYTNLGSDVYLANNLYYTSRQQLVSTYPYLQNFNATTGGWKEGGAGPADHNGRNFAHGPIPYLNGPDGEGDSWFVETSSSWNGTYIWVESPVFDLSAINSPQLSLDVKHGLHSSDFFQVQYSTNGGTSWTQLGSNEPNWYNQPNWWRGSINNPVDAWETVHHDMCTLAGESCVKFRVRGRPYYGNPQHTTHYFFGFDNVRITEGADVGVTTYVDPVDVGCLFSSTQQVTVTINNYGCLPISNVAVQCDITGALLQTLVGVVPGPIPAAGSVDYTFPVAFDMTPIGIYNFNTQTLLGGDVFTLNDQLATSINVDLPKISTFPYLEDFNSSTGYWTASGNSPPANNGRSFYHGALPYLNGPEGEGSCWYVETTSSWNGTYIWVESPVFDFTNLTNPTLSFDIKHSLHSSDFFQVKYSLDGGSTWIQLGGPVEPNWYNATNWWRNSISSPVDAWTTMSQNLCALSGEPCVKFRVRGRPYYGNPQHPQHYKFAFDNFEIDAGEPDDLAVREIILNDAGDCGSFSTTEPVKILVTNNTCRPLLNVPVDLQVDGGAIISEVMPGPVPGYGSYLFQFAATADLSAAGTHTLSVTSNLATDVIPANDNVQRTRFNSGGISAFPYNEDFNADNGGWVSKTSVAHRHFQLGELPYLNGPEGEGDSWFMETESSWNGTQIFVESPIFDFSALTEPHLILDVKHQLHSSDYTHVEYSLNGGSTWTQLGSNEADWYNEPNWWRNSINNPVDQWTKVHHDLCVLAGQSCVKLRVKGRPYYGLPQHTTHYFFGFDNVQIVDGRDVGVTTYIDPVDEGCLFATTQEVTVSVTNYSCSSVSNIPIQCDVSGVFVTTLNGVVPGPIAPGTTVSFTFPTGFDMTTIGTYNFSTQIFFPGDVFSENNVLNTSINVNLLKVTSYPYLEDFNSGAGFWSASGATPPLNNGRNFVLGALPYLNGPDGEGDSWYVETTSSWNGTYIWAESPVFDFTELTNPTLSFDIKHSLHSSDFFQVKYSLDGGVTWTQLGGPAEPNWYNAANWWRNSISSPLDSWASVSQELCQLSGESCVKFRVRGRPYYGNPQHTDHYKFAFDNFAISTGEPDDISPIEIILNGSGDCGSFTATENVAVLIKNYTCRTLYNVPIDLQLNGGAVISEIIPGPIPRLADYIYNFSATLDLSAAATHTISVTTNLVTDNVPANNTAVRTRFNAANISSFPYSEDFNVDNGGWVSRTSVNHRFFRLDTLPYLNGNEGEGNSWFVETTSSWNGTYIWVESPVFDFTALTSPEFSMDVKHRLHSSDFFQIQYSLNGGSSWVQLGSNEPDWYNQTNWWRNSINSPVDEWTNVHHDLCDLIGESCVKFRVRGRPYYGNPQHTTHYFFGFDNVEIRESIDVGVTAHAGPLDQGCLFSDNEQITVEVFNFISNGCAPIFNVPVKVDVSGPINTTLTGVVPGPIPVGGSVNYTFAGAVDMTAVGTYVFNSYSEQLGDANPANDITEHVIVVDQITISSFPYEEDFNSGPGYWLASGGAPPANNGRNFMRGALPYLNGPQGEGDSWYVETTSSWNGTYIWVESPVFDFTGVANPRMHFDLKHKLHSSDFFQVQYSINGGTSWSQLGSAVEPIWYNQPNWWRNSISAPVDQWSHMYKDLCSLAGESCVKFRMRGRPYYGNPQHTEHYKFAFDNFRITDTQVDAELVSVTGCWGSAYGIDVTIRNLDDLCIAAATITDINVSYQLDADPVVTIPYSGLNIQPNSTHTFTISGITVPSQLSALKVWVDAPNGLFDHVFDNDTLIPDLNTWPHCNDHCSNSIELGFGTTTASQTSNATVEVTEDPLFSGCGAITVENTVWYHFTTNDLGDAVQLDFHDMSCTPSANGVQVSILEINGAPCDPMNYTEVFCTSPQNINDFTFGPVVLPVNITYYIGIDGFAGNDCDFQITIAGSVTSVTVDPPTTSDYTTCVDPVNLTASGSTGNYRWYDQLIGGTILSTSNPFTVNPGVTTTYYVCAVDGIGTESNRIPATVTVDAATDPRVWNGDVSTDWHNADNWSCGGVPDQTVAVKIPNVSSGSGNSPIITAIGYAYDLRIDPQASMEIALVAQLEVAGNWNNLGSEEIGDGTVVFNGSAQQFISGNNHFGGIQLDNSSGLRVQVGVQQINIKLELKDGVFETMGNSVIINSDVNGTAYIDDFSPTFAGTITGNVTVERYISNGIQAYHYIGSPVDGATMADWDADFGISPTGFTVDGDQIIPTLSCDPNVLEIFSPFGNLFDYRENQVGTCYLDGWHVRTNGSLVNGKGFSAMLPNTTLLNVTGPATTGNVTLGGLTNTNVVGNGFNLVSNPYPSNIHWGQVISDPANSGFDATAYVWVAAGQYAGTYMAISGFLPTPYLASSQAFFVRLSSPGTGTFTFPQSARVAGDQSYYRQAAQAVSMFSLKLTSGDKADITHLLFDNRFTLAHDKEADAVKLIGQENTASISTLGPKDKQAIMALPSTGLPDRIALSLNLVKSGLQTIQVENYRELPMGITAYLKDEKLGSYNRISEYFEYEFSENKGGLDRFSIVFKMSEQEGLAQVQNLSSFISNNNLVIRFALLETQTGHVELRDLRGRTVMSPRVITSAEEKVNIGELACGSYIVIFTVDDETYSKKVTKF